MSPHPTNPPNPTITRTPQLLPRQSYNPSDPYGYSSLLAQLSALYPDMYTSNIYAGTTADYSSLIAYYSSLLSMYDYPTSTAAGAGRLTTTTRRTSATGVPRASITAVLDNTGNADSGASGLSTTAKIGIGVGVAVGMFVLVIGGILLWCCVKRRKKREVTIVRPHPAVAAASAPVLSQQHQAPPPPQMAYVNTAVLNNDKITSQTCFPSPVYPSPQQIPSPPPQYGHTLQQQQQQQQQPPASETQTPTKYAYNSPPSDQNVQVAELEHEYHSVKPGVVELGDGIREVEEEDESKKGWKLGKLRKKK